MPDAVILSGARTPIGRANKGGLIDVDAFELAQVAVGAAIDRSGVDRTDIDDLVVAESLQGGGVIARYAAVELGLAHVPGLADNRHCAAGLSAVQIAAGSIRAGMDALVVAGGTESLSSMPQGLKSIPASRRDYQQWMSPSHRATPEAPAFDMSITVGENTAREAGLTRADVDEWALHSHRCASESIARGWFAEEIVPVEAPQPDGTVRTIDTDEQPRPDTTLERLASLAVLHPELDDATVTAGNAAGLNDAAAALVVASDDYARAHGHTPLARVVSWASVGVEPARTGMAPIDAIPKALQRAGLGVGDIELFEINEAFCSVTVAAIRALGLDEELVNVNGSGCGLGHPIAATGARMVVTMLHELRRRGGTLGCVSMCAGGGMGSALVLELL
ncbi:MAG: thiolase family protein [Acidimicrobiales bacterium]|jgi:acetyl-CoA C-acetyltransferase|nr:thiolase family protein [Acidimicrobiales bacterium]